MDEVVQKDAAYVTGSNAPQTIQRSLEQTIGAQVRALRTRLGLKSAELAAAAGISGSLMSKIENGQVSPSLSTLQSLATALNVPIALLFAATEERRDCSYVRAGDGVVIERSGTKAGHQYRLLGHSLAGDLAVEPYLITLSLEAVPYTAFQHAGTELIHMLTGRVAYRHADRTYELGPGDTLMFDASAAHGPETLIELPMTYLSIIVFPREL
jgi:transcriptional regulator with XRE-family HTH domain